MFKKLTDAAINNALKGTTRQYLVGRLELPQALAHIDDGNIEIGITDYMVYTAEAPHWHEVAHEYQYMLSGETKYLDVDTGEETFYSKGDFYRIDPKTKYAQKAIGGTSILFVKTPPGNDKIALETDSATEKWLEKWV